MLRRTGSVPSLRGCSSRLLFIIPLLTIWQTPTGLADSVTVHRCIGNDGTLEFRQGPCERGRQQKVQVDTTPTGWVPPVRTPGSIRPKRTVRPESGRGNKRATRTVELKLKQEKACWRMQKRLEKVEWRMRRGYKAGKGPALRRQRRDYEDYLRRFC